MLYRFTFLLFLFSFFTTQIVSARISERLEEAFLSKGGDPKSLSHLKCFIRKYSQAQFKVKKVNQLGERCNQLESGGRFLTVGNMNRAVIVDYNKTSDKRRLFILNFDQTGPNIVQPLFTSHGRFGNTSRSNTTPGKNRNTVKEIKYYSNKKGSNASPSGFAITGRSYIGRWSGPDGRRQSMVIHGIEKNINDNSCERAIVMHGNSYIHEIGSHQGVRRMSSGCYMLDYSIVNKIVNQLRGPGGDLNPSENTAGGVIFFTYGPREKELAEDFYCNEASKSSLLLAEQ